MHEIYRSWRRVLDAYEGERVFVGEVWLPTPAQFVEYLRPDELHSAFNFEFLCARVGAGRDARGHRRHAGQRTRAVGAPPTWVLSNHDTIRHVTRYGRDDTAFDMAQQAPRHADRPGAGHPPRSGRGTADPGACPAASISIRATSSAWPRSRTSRTSCCRTRPGSGPAAPTEGRDGCRVPLPWSGDAAAVRLLRRPGRAAVAAAARGVEGRHGRERRTADGESMLALYRRALRPAPGAPPSARPRISNGWNSGTGRCWHSGAVTSCASSTSATDPMPACRTHGVLVLASDVVTDGRCPPIRPHGYESRIRDKAAARCQHRYTIGTTAVRVVLSHGHCPVATSFKNCPMRTRAATSPIL